MIRLPKDLLTQNYTKPKVYLCEVDKKKICQLETTNLQGTFKFNAYSEISFTVGRMYTNTVTGETSLNPFYDKIEALRLIELEGFGYFEIQDPEIVSDGIQEVKNITAYSLEYTLSQKYIEGFNINTGENNSVEVVYANGPIIPVTLYNPDRKELSLLHIVLEKVYGWEVGHIDESLKTMSRTFEISRVSVYDFIMQDICDKFNCYVVFDTIAINAEGKRVNRINIYAEALTTKRRGDGITTTFYTDNAYKKISSISIDSYKTTEYTHTFIDGGVSGDDKSYITFTTPPKKGAAIEIIDGSQLNWTTDVYVSFQNLAQEIDISYSADDIKTVLTVKGADDLDIREVNMGLPYLTDISYYCNVSWMGQELYDAYLTYSKKCEESQQVYVENSAQMLELQNEIHHEANRISLQYVISTNVGTNTVGTYYVKGTDVITGYDSYKEVKLPDEFNANVVYYTLNYVGINEEKFSALYAALQTYFMSQDKKDVSKLDEIKDQFEFLHKYTIDALIQDLSKATELSQKNTAILRFLEGIWPELGYNPLDSLYYKPYKMRKENAETDGWNNLSSENYWQYYPVTLVVSSIETAMEAKEELITEKKNAYDALAKDNSNIVEETSIANNFTKEQQAKLSSFLREDEYTDDNFFITEYDTTDDIMRTKQELLQCGRIELQKLCEPKLSFSMDMANIYAMPEFEPIIHQFDLGKLISIEIRPKTVEDAVYVKQARLLQVDFNFENFSDFSCEFGELTSLRTPSSIHADLLSTALSAGKSVASNASYWNKGTNMATSTDLKIQQGLLATNGLYTSDQSVVIDNNGIRLRKVNEDGSFSPYQAWIKNNTILLSSTGFAEGSVSELGLGEFTVDGTTFYGILAQAILSGYIESSTMVGGTIKIGKQLDGTYAFEVDEKGNVSMLGGDVKFTNDTNSLNIMSDRLDKRINETNATIERTNESIEAEVSRAEGVEKSLRSSITINADAITSEVVRAKNAEEELRSSITINTDAITSKVERNDFGTLIEQNYDHVKIAWNNNSKYIAFEDGALNIYTSSSHSSSTLLMKQNYQGAWYYHKGDTIGKIGTNSWSNDSSYRGLVFDLENGADYMCWAHKDNASDSAYTVKFIYHASDSKRPEGLHFECNTYANNHLYLNDTNKFVSYTGGSVGYNGQMRWVNASNKAFISVDGSASEPFFSIHGGSKFNIWNDVDVNIYSNIKLHNYKLIDTEITTSSDIRLKTNIQDTRVDALDTINQIKLKEFDWIESKEHEAIGMIAQQLQTVLPDLVYEDEHTGSLSIKMTKFIPYLIKSIQELTEYVTGTTTTFALRNNLEDTYSENEKLQFVLAKSTQNYNEEILVEAVCEPTRLPIEQKGEDNNE